MCRSSRIAKRRFNNLMFLRRSRQSIRATDRWSSKRITYPKKIPSGTVVQSAVLNFRLRRQVLGRVDWRDHSLDGQKRGEVRGVGGYQDQSEEPPDAAGYAARYGSVEIVRDRSLLRTTNNKCNALHTRWTRLVQIYYYSAYEHMYIQT